MPTSQQYGFCLTRAVVLAVALAAASAPTIAGDILLPTVEQARNQPPDSSGNIVRLRGTVTAFSGWKNSFFLQDSTGAISVDRTEDTALTVGDEVEVSGTTQAGLFANIFVSHKAQVLGHRRLPTAQAATHLELQTGELDSRFIEVRGTVRSVRVDQMWGQNMLFIELQTGDSSITVYLPHYAGLDTQYLVDSEVRVTGVCGTIFNHRRQLIGLRLFVNSLDQVEVLSRAQDPAIIPISPLASLLTFHGPSLSHRVRVRGTVTYQSPNGEMFLQQGQAAIRVLSRSLGVWVPGMQVEALGFVANRGYLPDLENALIQGIQSGKPPAPIQIQASDVIQFESGFKQAPYDGLLVQMDAKIVDRLPNTGSLIWMLEAGGIRFEAELHNAPREWALAFEAGTQVKIIGLCAVEADRDGNFNTFHLLLRSADDMTVAQEPYWNQSLLLLLATYALILLGSLFVYLVLKRRFPGSQAAPFGEPKSELIQLCRRLSEFLAIAAMTVGLGVLFLSASGGREPVSLFSVGVSGVFSGPALLAAGLSTLLRYRVSQRAVTRLRIGLVGVVILTGALGLLAPVLFPGLTRLSHMPLSTALCLLLLGAASALIQTQSRAAVAQVFALTVAFTCLIKLVGVLYGAALVNGLAAHLFMSLPVAVALLLLSAALLLSSCESGIMQAVCSAQLGGLMLRRVLPAVVLGPIFIGWIRLQLQVLGLFDTRFGLTLFALSNVLCFCFLIWTSAAVLNHIDRAKSLGELSLRERDRKLELIFESGSMGDWTWDAEPDAFLAHSSVWKLHGEPDKRGSEPIEWFRSRQHPDDLALIDEEWERTRTDRCPLDLEYRVIWPDASVHWVYCRAVARFDAKGRLVQMSGIDLDITDRKRAEEKLKDSERLFRQLQDAMPQMIWTSDKHGAINHYNRRWYEYTGLLPGQPWSKVVPANTYEDILEKWTVAIQKGEPYENEIQLRRAVDGTFRWQLARSVPVHNAQGEVEQWFGTCTDIDDFKRASAELSVLNATLERRAELRALQLAQTEHQYRVLVDSVKDYALYMLDVDGNVTTWNDGAERLKGYKAREIIGVNFSIFFTLDEIADGEPRRNLSIAAAEGHFSREAVRVRKDGTQFWASLLISPVHDVEGKLTGFSKVVRDVTERYQAQQLLVEAQKRAEEANLAKSRFLAAMSHEIRTPMNAILGMADLLWDTELDRDQREYVGRFRRAGANLLTLINDILDLSKIESGRLDLEMVDFDLLEIVDRVVEIATPLASAKGINFEVRIVPGTPAFLEGDPVRLQQVLNNLIGNAIKFTLDGKVVLYIGAHADGARGHLQFAVRDTGIGIPPDKMNAIFEDFTQAESSTTRRFGGTGLGLGICRRLVDKMKGTLGVESVLGHGSTFRFDATFSISLTESSSTPKELGDLIGKSVLVVDDNATNRIIICEMCAAWGMKTRAAASATEAFLLLAAARQIKEEYALILLDRVLPDARGFEALREIKCIDPNIPVIISSSDNQSGDMTESRALGAAAYLMKPVRRAELRSCIFEALSTATASLSETSHSESLRRLRILLAEDSEDNRFLVQAYLAGHGHDLTFVENGQQAVDACADRSFDIILMDVQMPLMDGLTATKRIRGIERERSQDPMVIVALTANALAEDARRSMEAGCTAHLAKPISKDKLLATIETYQH